MKTRISLFIITKNEEKNISKCLISARSLVNEIIVVDSCSKDKTALICQELGAQVFERDFDGFTNQKNFALSKVSGDWALSLDADETLTHELVEEIKQAVQTDKYDGYELIRTNSFWGKQMKYGGIKAEPILRLVRTNKATFKGGLVHEKLEVKGPVGRLKNTFIHHSYPDIESYFEKFNHYTTLAARTMYDKKRRFSVCAAVFRIPFDFAKRYVFQLGFLDGFRGLMWAVFSAGYSFTKYAKLWQLEQTKGRKH